VLIGSQSAFRPFTRTMTFYIAAWTEYRISLMRNPPEYQNPLQGMALMAGAMLVLPTMDAIAKYMATVEAMSPGQ